jgi:hypothetical protein
LKEKFPKLSDAKLKDVIFIGPHIPYIINDDLYEHLLTSEWITFKAGCLNFLGNVKAQNYIGTCCGLAERKPGYGA